MPAGVDAVLGVRGYDKINKVLGVLGLRQFTAREDNNIYETEEAWNLSRFNLVEAHVRCLMRVFPKVRRPRHPWSYIFANTPAGYRNFMPFDLVLYYNPNELGHTPDSMVFGVTLSSRHTPAYLDWRDRHGGIDAVKLDKHTLDMIDHAKSEISNVIPVAAEFEVMFVEVWHK